MSKDAELKYNLMCAKELPAVSCGWNVKSEAESNGIYGCRGRNSHAMHLYVTLWCLAFNLKGGRYKLKCLKKTGR